MLGVGQGDRDSTHVTGDTSQAMSAMRYFSDEQVCIAISRETRDDVAALEGIIMTDWTREAIEQRMQSVGEPQHAQVKPPVLRPTAVVVTDIHMSFTSMVAFMVKWAIASIPALLILFVLGFVVTAIGAGFLRSLLGLH